MLSADEVERFISDGIVSLSLLLTLTAGGRNYGFAGLVIR